MSEEIEGNEETLVFKSVVYKIEYDDENSVPDLIIGDNKMKLFKMKEEEGKEKIFFILNPTTGKYVYSNKGIGKELLSTVPFINSAFIKYSSNSKMAVSKPSSSKKRSMSPPKIQEKVQDIPAFKITDHSRAVAVKKDILTLNEIGTVPPNVIIGALLEYSDPARLTEQLLKYPNLPSEARKDLETLELATKYSDTKVPKSLKQSFGAISLQSLRGKNKSKVSIKKMGEKKANRKISRRKSLH